MPFTPDRGAGLVPREVGRHGKDPRPGLLGTVSQRTHEHFLSQVFGPLSVPHLAVEKTDYRRVGGLVQLFKLIHDWRSRDTPLALRPAESPMRTADLRELAQWLRRTHAAPGEDAPGMQRVFFRRPVAAEIRFGRPAVCPAPTVQRTGYTVIVEIAAGRNDLC